MFYDALLAVRCLITKFQTYLYKSTSEMKKDIYAWYRQNYFSLTSLYNLEPIILAVRNSNKPQAVPIATS